MKAIFRIVGKLMFIFSGVLMFFFWMIAMSNWLGFIGSILSIILSPGLVVFPIVFWIVEGVFPVTYFIIWGIGVVGSVIVWLSTDK